MSIAPADTRRSSFAALAAAFLGWMFDGFEMGLFPYVGKPALQDLLSDMGSPAELKVILDNWFSVIIATFLVGAATGGVFFGWLGDRIGRVRAMSISIFVYAIFTGLCGFATEAWHIAILRFVASLGMGGEWALGVALVNELWQGNRAWVAGAIGAAANIGYILVGLLGWAITQYSLPALLTSIGVSESIADSLSAHGGWRFLMISGAFPALLIFFIRIFVKESHKWEEEKASGATSHWNTKDLVGVLVGALAALVIIWAWSPMGIAAGITAPLAGVITVIFFAIVIWGFLLPVRRYLGRSEEAGHMSAAGGKAIKWNLFLGSSLAGIALLGTWGATQQAMKWSTELAANGWNYPREITQIATALGATVFAFLAPLVADMLNRRITYTLCCAAALASVLVFYQTNIEISNYFVITAFLMGGITATFYGFLPLYLPELFPTAVRATGQGFSFNVGRVIAAIGGLQIANLVSAFGTAGFKSSANAYSTLAMIYLVGMVLVWLAPETKGKALPK
jgi:MFS family permease